MKITDDAKRKQLTVYIPDTRGVTISRYGIGNLKIGPGVYTYSRLPGAPTDVALGMPARPDWRYVDVKGTCPGATQECQAICYAARPVTEKGVVFAMWAINSATEDVPEIPEDCKILRIHISGDFSSVQYIRNWIDRIRERPDVTVWAYTRSWRVAALLPSLEELRTMPNVQLFASMDKSTQEDPPAGWRAAWIANDARLSTRDYDSPVDFLNVDRNHYANVDGSEAIRLSYTCPEETGHKPNCLECTYCFDGAQHDVTFIQH